MGAPGDLEELEGVTGAISGHCLNARKWEGKLDGVEVLELWDVDTFKNFFEVVVEKTFDLEGFKAWHVSSSGYPGVDDYKFALID